MAKKSVVKISVAGRKYALRRLSEDDACIYGQQLDARARAERAELPLEALKMSPGESVIEALFGGTGGDIRNP